jgi:hypothetical protein
MTLASMRNQTLAAVLNAFLGIRKMTSAAFTQGVKWTITEEAIEVLGMRGGMTRKVFAIHMAEKSTPAGF